MLYSLTSFRFIAALMVFIFHIGILKDIQLGSAGVSFFFVLSGFILAFNYSNKITNINKKAIKEFYLARFAKIYPMHVLTFLIASPLVILYFNPNGFYLIKLAFMSGINLFLVQSFIPKESTYFNFNVVSWTLSAESFFYLMFPFILISIKKLKERYFLWLFLLFISWIALFSLNLNIGENDKFILWLLHICPIFRIFEFIIGMVLGLIFLNKHNEINLKSSIFNYLELFSVLTFVIMIIVSNNIPLNGVRGGYFIPIWSILIFVFAFQKGFISRLLSNKYAVYLGEISFSFYMVHGLIIRYIGFLNFNFISNFIICFSLSIILSHILFKYYEEPMRKTIRFGIKPINKTVMN